MMLNLHQVCLEGITTISFQDQNTGAVKGCKKISSFSFVENSIEFLHCWIWFRYNSRVYN